MHAATPGETLGLCRVELRRQQRELRGRPMAIYSFGDSGGAPGTVRVLRPVIATVPHVPHLTMPSLKAGTAGFRHRRQPGVPARFTDTSIDRRQPRDGDGHESRQRTSWCCTFWWRRFTFQSRSIAQDRFIPCSVPDPFDRMPARLTHCRCLHFPRALHGVLLAVSVR